MRITKEQASLLADLTYALEEKYGLVVGYFNPNIQFQLIDGADFVICVDEINEHDVDYQCIYKDDVPFKNLDNYDIEPKHDDKVKALIDRINLDILDGKLLLDPGVTREVDGVMYTVTKRVVSKLHDLEIFETNVVAPNGVIHTYQQIESYAKSHPHFKALKKIVDEIWPDAKQNSLVVEKPNQKPDPKDLRSENKLISAVSDFIRRLFGR